MSDQEDGDASEAFYKYKFSTKDPGPWLLLATILSVVLLVFCYVPFMVTSKKRKQKENKESEKSAAAAAAAASDSYVRMDETNGEQPSSETNALPAAEEGETEKGILDRVVRYDKESKRIVSGSIPFTVSSILLSSFSLMCLILVSHTIGTRAAVAYALVHIFLGTSEQFLSGPTKATTTLCARAVATEKYALAGQYTQLSIWLRLILSGPFVALWYCCTYEIVLWLEWGDDVVAQYAQDYVRVYVWATLVDCVHSAISRLLESSGHENYTNTTALAHGLTNVIVFGFLTIAGVKLELRDVGIIFLCSSVFFFLFTSVVTCMKGWLRKFAGTLLWSPACQNSNAVMKLLKAATPLAFGSVLSNLEWLVLTFFAADMGPAEVATWAMLKFIWEFCEASTSGIGEATELRVAHHLGTNRPGLAKLSALKCIYLGMILAFIMSAIFLVLLPFFPKVLTYNDILEERFRETLPFVVIGNLSLSLAKLCSYVVGAQSRYKLCTGTKFVCTWAISIPLAAAFVYGFKFNVEGLITSVVIGTVGMAALVYVVHKSDWGRLAARMHAQILRDAKEEEGAIQRREQAYALMLSRTRSARSMASRNMIVFTAPPEEDLGLTFEWIDELDALVITEISQASPVRDTVRLGDKVFSIDNYQLTTRDQWERYEDLLDDPVCEREIALYRSSGSKHRRKKSTDRIPRVVNVDNSASI